MKKIYSLLSVVLVSGSLLSQSDNIKIKTGTVSSQKKITLKSNSANKTTSAIPGDTVGRTSDFVPVFNETNMTLYGVANGGSIYGKNGDSLNGCAQYYQNINNTTLKISKIVISVGSVVNTTSLTTSYVKLTVSTGAPNKAYHIVGTALESSPTAKGPGTALSTVTVDVNALAAGAAGNFMTVTLPSAITVTGDMVIGLDARFLANGDTASFVSDKTGDGLGLGYALTRYAPPLATPTSTYSSYVWLLATEAWSSGGAGLDNNIAAFAICDIGTAVTEYFNGMKLSTNYPNPAFGNTTINYSLENDSKNVSLVVYDLTGKKLFDENYNDQKTGNYSVKLNTENFAAGSYYYQLRANGSLLTKEFVIAK